ncbi:MAG: TolC family protein [Candidatus Omnitrophota bacterium]
MLRDLKINLFLLLIGTCGSLLLSYQLCFAETPAQLKNVSLKRTDDGIEIFLEHSKPPIDIKSEKSEEDNRLYIYIQGSQITFKSYQNVPIEIPVKKNGVEKLVFEEKTDFKTSSRSVVVFVETDRSFVYNMDSQWKGQFVRILVSPRGEAPPKPIITKKEDDFKRLKLIRKVQDKEAEEAKQRLKVFADEKRQQLLQQENKAKIEKIRSEAKKRQETAPPLEKAYEKLKAQTEKSEISSVREEIMEKNLYKDVTMPSELKPVMVRSGGPALEVSSLDDCVAVAIKNYTPLQIAKEQQKLAKFRVKEARRAFYPAFFGEFNTTEGDTVTEPYRGRSYGVRAEQPLFTGGKLTSTLKKEQLGELIARGNFDKVKQDFIFQINKAYYELLLGKSSLDYLKVLKQKADEIILSVEQEFKIGSVTPAILLTCQSFYNQVYFQVASAEREFELAKLNLEKAMYIDDLNIDKLDYNLKYKKIEVDLEQCLDLAFRNRTELKILERTIESAKYGEDIIRSEQMPNVSLIGTYGRSGEAFSERELVLATEWSAMLGVRWFLGGNTLETGYKQDKVSPYKVTRTDTNVESKTYNAKFSFWDNLAHFTKQKEALITKKQAEKDLQEMKNKIRQETEDAYYSYLKFNSQFSLAMNEIAFRRKQLEIIIAKRRMNEASAAEVMEAEMQLTQANGNLKQALSGINISITALNRAIGVINYFN